VKRFDVYLVGLDPARGLEMKKTRPCVIVSPDEINTRLNTVIVAPLATTDRPYPFRPRLIFKRKAGSIALDHLRAVDRSRLIRKVGRVEPSVARAIAETIVEMFAFEE
jgi:mRNA interferase MazF